MHYIYKWLICLVTGAFFIACTSSSSDKPTYVAGEIFNPNTNYITITKNDSLVDTVYLNKNNKFNYVFKDKPHGLYTFWHYPESQFFYIEPGDSLLFRLNTLEFDESLMFSGDGAVQNNFLNEMFLLNENNNNLIFSYYKIPPQKFANLTDSVKTQRQIKLAKLAKNHGFCEDFFQFADKTILYEYYDMRERYSFLLHRYMPRLTRHIPTNFYDYRKEANFNDSTLMSHYTYQRFLDNYIKNKSIENCKNTPTQNCFSLSSVANLKKRIEISDSIFSDKQLKEQFIKRFAIQGLTFSETPTEIQDILRLSQKSFTDSNKIKEITALAQMQEHLLPRKSITNIQLLNSTGETVNVVEKFKKPIISFNWSIKSSAHYKAQHKLIHSLREKYPEIVFIGINIDIGDIKSWQTLTENIGFNPEYEYQLKDNGIDKKLYQHYLNKVLFINKKGIVWKNTIQLNDPYLEQHILAFLNH